MKVTVDRMACGLNGECVLAAPNVFRFDDDGELEYDERPAESERAAVEDAVASCPMAAISLDED